MLQFPLKREKEGWKRKNYFYVTGNDVLGCNIQIAQYRTVGRHMSATANGSKTFKGCPSTEPGTNTAAQKELNNTPNWLIPLYVLYGDSPVPGVHTAATQSGSESFVLTELSENDKEPKTHDPQKQLPRVRNARVRSACCMRRACRLAPHSRGALGVCSYPSLRLLQTFPRLSQSCTFHKP